MRTIFGKIIKYAGIGVASILLLLFLLPLLFPGAIPGQIKKWTNESIEGELNFSKISLSFFQHFPSLTLTLHDFSLTGSEPFAKDTLIAGRALSFGINLSSIFEETLEVNKFFVDNAFINIQVDEKGNANYNVYKGNSEAAADSSNTRLKIEGIFIKNSHLVYHDRSMPILIDAKGFQYEGRGDLTNEQFDLLSRLSAGSFDFVYDNTVYVQRKNISADLVTGINTSSLEFKFAKNNLLINHLPVDFTGSMAILKEGYDIDLKIISGTTEFGNIFSALPPEYDSWFAETKFSGKSQVRVDMKGSYRAATEQAPDLIVRLWVHDGMINHNAAPAPLQHFWANATVLMPRLNLDSISLTIDTLKFDLNGAPTNATFFIKGIEHPYIKADVNSSMDLALLDRALGLSAADLQGQFSLKASADGYYRTGQNPDNFRPEIVTTSIPKFNLEAAITNGYFKDKDLPMAVEQLQAQIKSSCANGKWQDIAFAIENLNAVIGQGSVGGNFVLKGLEKTALKADFKANLKLEDLARAIPMGGYNFGGELFANLQADGRLDVEKKLFPASNGTLQLKKGLIQTPYYPNPIENLQVLAGLDCKSGRYGDLAIQVKPVSFVFEGKPFAIEADLKNLDDLRYDVKANGTLDLGKIYQVFAVEGYNVVGLLHANLDLHGTQADAAAGRYERLRNSGTLRVQNLELHSNDYPFPFLVPAGTLRFEQDKAWLENALLRYRNNDFTLNGYAENFIGHSLTGSLLQGKLSVTSPRLVVDDFMVFASAPTSSTATATASASGVVLLPTDMDLTLKASIKEIIYGETKLENFSGELALQQGKLILKKTKIGIAGATISMEGNYTPVNLRKATFDFRFKADSFDVKRAYNEVPLFREMATSAEKAEGLVSVDYQLQGRLNDKMEPVYPSIKGKGVVKLEQVKVNGLKLFGAVAKATEKDSIGNPDMKAVIIKSSIANNIITIERTKVKTMGFRLRMEGQTSLDGRLNMRFRLGLPPFGVIGIPMTITGTSDEPIVTVRKGKEEDELEEEEDNEEQ
jgi:AsmA protein